MITMSDAASFASIIESLFVVVSVVLIVVQLRKQTEFARASNSQSMFELSSPFNLELIRDKDFARLWLQGPNTSDPIDQFRYESLVTWWLLLHENIYYQRQRGLLDDEAYLAWDQDLRDFAQRSRLENVWPTIKRFYQRGFAIHVSEVLAESSGAVRSGAPNIGSA
jgi:hypothetical protein